VPVLKKRAAVVLREGIAEQLEKEGFRRERQVYLRERGQMMHLLDVQYSQWNDETEVTFTLNCGIYREDVTSLFRNAAPPRHPKVTDCCIFARIGMLTESHLDLWWKVTAGDTESADAKVRQQLGDVVARYALPFFEGFPDERAAAQFLSAERPRKDEYVEPREPAVRQSYAAALWRLVGDAEACRRCLQASLSAATNGPLADVVRQFANRCHC
jgi:hypothetical protein